MANADKILQNPASYQEYSFRNYRRSIEAIKIELAQKTLSEAELEILVRESDKAKSLLIDAAKYADAIKSFHLENASQPKLKAFDLLQRALYSPTEYVIGKENGLELRKPYRRDGYDKNLRNAKTKEIEAKWNAFIKAK